MRWVDATWVSTGVGGVEHGEVKDDDADRYPRSCDCIPLSLCAARASSIASPASMLPTRVCRWFPARACRTSGRVLRLDGCGRPHLGGAASLRPASASSVLRPASPRWRRRDVLFEAPDLGWGFASSILCRPSSILRFHPEYVCGPNFSGHGRRQDSAQMTAGTGGMRRKVVDGAVEDVGSAQGRSESAAAYVPSALFVAWSLTPAKIPTRIRARVARKAPLRSAEDLVPGGGSRTKEEGSMRKGEVKGAYSRLPPAPRADEGRGCGRILHFPLEPAHAHDAHEQDLDHEVHVAPTSRTAYTRTPAVRVHLIATRGPIHLGELGHDQDEHHPSAAPPLCFLPCCGSRTTRAYLLVSAAILVPALGMYAGCPE
ncbi:hypothetical protein B0H17DRAFT_563578 [Mycena rosella]|uniref:Uncharacterized protein n=1 Tax=Mycena rosella TaxID=1033263 RepID=A0AAD7FIM1_MYCRO|nr:hypothetical protein B0H17DRAFT_563578 [Mycena rosella]